MKKPDILALDFDGVICNGLQEYLETTFQAYRLIWSLDDSILREDVGLKFYNLRPIVEVGWQMPLLMRAIMIGLSSSDIEENWATLCESILKQDNKNQADIAEIVDQVRDRSIEEDLDGWLNLHEFYPSIIDTLKETDLKVVIISTKEGRFIKQLLDRSGWNIPVDAIIGKESKKPKYQVLQELDPTSNLIWFVEDRLLTLRSVAKQPDLNSVELFLADWGYNTQLDRDHAQTDPRIKLLSLTDFRSLIL